MTNVQRLKHDARTFDLYDRRDYWYAGQTVSFSMNGVIVQGEILGFLGGECPGLGSAYSFVEVDNDTHYKMWASSLLVPV